MDWKKIEEDCPKAWRLFSYAGTKNIQCYSNGNYCYDLVTDVEIPIRGLYDFFDGQEIIVMLWHKASGCVHVQGDRWNFKIDRRNGRILKDGRIGPEHETRSVAETAAFIKAFEILEVMLKKKEKKI